MLLLLLSLLHCRKCIARTTRRDWLLLRALTADT
jgi:hypothetical protein